MAQLISLRTTRARRTLINLLRELPITTLVSTHEMKLVEELIPRTIVIDKGLIVADGKTKDILANAKLLEARGLEKPYAGRPLLNCAYSYTSIITPYHISI